MRRSRRKFDLYIVIFLAAITACYFLYNHYSSEDRGIKAYKRALELYKDYDYD